MTFVIWDILNVKFDQAQIIAKASAHKDATCLHYNTWVLSNSFSANLGRKHSILMPSTVLMVHYMLEVFFDGLCIPNDRSGIPCYGFLIKKDGQVIYSDKGVAAKPFSDEATNNVAEYTALIKALQWLKEMDMHHQYQKEKLILRYFALQKVLITIHLEIIIILTILAIILS